MSQLALVPRPRLIQVVNEAITRIVPVIKYFMMTGKTEHRQSCYIVVAYGPEWPDALLTRRDVNNAPGEKAVIALSKAQISHREMKPTCDVPLHEREAGDTQYWGSAVAPHIGLVVAISGLQPWFDEQFSWLIEATTIGLLKDYGLIETGPDWDRDQPAFLTQTRIDEIRRVHADMVTTTRE